MISQICNLEMKQYFEGICLIPYFKDNKTVDQKYDDLLRVTKQVNQE